jgi:hypothetical protein
MKPRSETLANVALAVMCLVVTGVTLDRYVLRRNVQADPRPGYRQGQRLSGPMRDLIGQRTAVTALLVVSQNCRFCLDSVGFYRDLVALRSQVEPARFQTLFIGFQEEDAKAFLAKNQLPTDDLRATPTGLSEHVLGTPTLLVVDGNGLIIGAWTGRLSRGQEKDVISTVTAVAKNFGR